jgi:predicted SnoaL-like aldol condensation-catalyzing enzyme
MSNAPNSSGGKAQVERAGRNVVHNVVEQIIHGKRLDLIDELYTADYVGHQIPAPLPQTREGQNLFVGAFQTAFDVWRIEGNRIAEYWGVVDFAGLVQQVQG